MNCKPGDLAVIVRCDIAENLGGLVCVIEPDNKMGWWRVEPLSRSLRARHRDTGRLGPLRRGVPTVVPDANLRPIRGEPGRDETLEWAGVPQYLHPKRQVEFTR